MMGQKCTSMKVFPTTRSVSCIFDTNHNTVSKTHSNQPSHDLGSNTNPQHFESIYNSNAELPTTSDLNNLPSSSTSNSYNENLTDDKCQSNVKRRSKKRSTTSKKKKKKRDKRQWIFEFSCSRHKCSIPNVPHEPERNNNSCSCIGYNSASNPQPSQPSQAVIVQSTVAQVELIGSDPVIDLSKFNPEQYPIEDCDERARLERAREIAEGVDAPPGFSSTVATKMPPSHTDINLDNLKFLLQSALSLSALSQIHVPKLVHSQVDYIHCLVPDLLKITSCSFYWGKMDRYDAEKLLENKPEGTFLLRDSAQEQFLFSVSFRKYGRSLHARIEQWNHRFSFDSHDPGVFSSNTICGLIEHYKDPTCCMFFEPALTTPLHRNFTFSLQHLCRAVICDNLTYDSISYLPLPKFFKSYLKEYHYMQRVRVRKFEHES